MLHALTHLHPIKRQGLSSTAKMSELASHSEYTTTTRRRSARLSSIGGDSTPKPTPCPRKRKRLDDDELTEDIQGQRDFQIPDPLILELSPKEHRKSRKRKTNEVEGPELQRNLSPVYIIPDVEKKEINFHGRLGVSELWNAECMKFMLLYPTRLCLSEHRPSNKEACCWFDLLFKDLPVSSNP